MLILATRFLRRRECDAYGCGHFGASRNDGAHTGQDYVCDPGETIRSPITGNVKELGHAFDDDPSFRYVAIRDSEGNTHRIMCIEPLVAVGDHIIANYTAIGITQDIQSRFPKDDEHDSAITNHVHYEITTADGENVDPESFK